ncbi:MAG TPA: hypothetical protein VEU47_09320 [Candidatus Cybelea sp.]|nr:hypothetical protein [Candidatus Cybelea sp.]
MLRREPGGSRRVDATLLAAIGLCVLAVLCSGWLALWLGQDANWDLRNYHFYNPYAFLNGRLDFDVAPAHVATYYNPLLHVPFYWLVRAASPKLTGFVLGGAQGLNFALTLLVCWRLVPAGVVRHRLALAGGLSAAGFVGAMGLSEVGTSFGDNVLSLFVLGSLAILVWRSETLASGALRSALGLALVAGVLGGVAPGLKQTAAAFAVGLCGACLAVPGTPLRRLAVAFAFGLGVLVSIAALDGFWLLDMWRRYANPLFPYFQDVFRSPWATMGDYRDNRFTPKTVFELAALPLLFVAPHLFSWAGIKAAPWGAEVAFFDLKPLLTEALFLAWAGAAMWRRARRVPAAGAPPDPAGGIALTFVVLTWVVWAQLFGIYRYMVGLELVMPLSTVLLAERVFTAARMRLIVPAIAILAAAVTVKPANWGRVAWSDAYFGVPVPELRDPEHTMVLMVGPDPTAFVIPEFPKAVRFLRIEGWFTGPSAHPNRMDRLMYRLVQAHTGPIFVLFRANEQELTASDALASYGLEMQSPECRDLKIAIERNLVNPLRFCRAVPASGGKTAPIR